MAENPYLNGDYLNMLNVHRQYISVQKDAETVNRALLDLNHATTLTISSLAFTAIGVFVKALSFTTGGILFGSVLFVGLGFRLIYQSYIQSSQEKLIDKNAGLFNLFNPNGGWVVEMPDIDTLYNRVEIFNPVDAPRVHTRASRDATDDSATAA